MELKEFVAQSIIQITEGITNAQESTKHKGAMINPPLCMSGQAGDKYLSVNMGNKRNFIPQTITFDVLVNVESIDSSDGKAKISIVSFSAGGGVSSEQKNGTSSRITFSVPVCWPPAYEPIEEKESSSILFDRSSSGPRWMDEY